MPSSRTSRAAAPPGPMSAGRSARLYQLILQLRSGPRSRDQLARGLKLDMRGFYRDLKKLRELGVRILSQGHRYRLGQSFERAISRLPLPDPRLSLHDAILLGEGTTPAHRKLRAQIRKIFGRKG